MKPEKVIVGEKEIILVGTAHVSGQSVELARKTILEELPEVVGIELDFPRLHSLLSGGEPDWSALNPNEFGEGSNSYLFLLNIWLSGMQKRIGEELGIKPGSEMIEAYKTAMESGIPVALLDRDVRITLGRALALSGAKEKIGIILELAGSALFGFGEKLTPEKVEELKKQDVMDKLMDELSRKAPGIKKVLVDERDSFIAERILGIPAKRIVAIVGAGHVEGIKKCLKGKRADLSKISFVPARPSALRYARWLIPAIFVLCLGLGTFHQGIIFAPRILLLWIAFTGFLSATGALLAGGRPASVIAAFVSAPAATLVPLAPAGKSAGLAESLYSRKSELASPALAKNFLTRVAKVIAFSGILAWIGAILGLAACLALA